MAWALLDFGLALGLALGVKVLGGFFSSIFPQNGIPHQAFSKIGFLAMAIPDASLQLYNTSAQRAYTGPMELRLFADILPYIGELAISFSAIERRVVWGIEALLGCTSDEGRELEDFVKNYSSRLKFLEVTGASVARESKTEVEFKGLITSLQKANTFRNMAIHNEFNGIAQSRGADGNFVTTGLVKNRHSEKAAKRGYQVLIKDLRANSERNYQICNEIQLWILKVRPNANNSVP